MHPAREGSLVLSVTGPGADGSSAAPEFGIAAVVDRFSQIEPKLIFAADGYRFNGRDFDRRESLEKIVGSLPTLEHLVWLPYLDTSAKAPSIRATIREFGELSRNYSVSVADFKFERVAYDHPLWILYSSGTTGLPKAIVHRLPKAELLRVFMGRMEGKIQVQVRERGIGDGTVVECLLGQ